MKLHLPMRLRRALLNTLVVTATLAAVGMAGSAQAREVSSLTVRNTQTETDLIVTGRLTLSSSATLNADNVTVKDLQGSYGSVLNVTNTLTFSADDSANSYPTITAGTLQANGNVSLSNCPLTLGNTIIAEGKTLTVSGRNSTLGHVSGGSLATSNTMSAQSVNAQDLTVKGTLNVSGDVTVDKLLGSGTLSASGHSVTINEGGTVQTKITADTLNINGDVALDSSSNGLKVGQFIIAEGKTLSATGTSNYNLGQVSGGALDVNLRSDYYTVTVSSMDVDSLNITKGGFKANGSVTLGQLTGSGKLDASGHTVTVDADGVLEGKITAGTLQVSGNTALTNTASKAVTVTSTTIDADKTLQLQQTNNTQLGIVSGEGKLSIEGAAGATYDTATATSVSLNALDMLNETSRLTATSSGDAFVLNLSSGSSNMAAGRLTATTGNITLSGSQTNIGTSLSATQGTVDLSGLNATFTGSIEAKNLKLNAAPDGANSFTTRVSGGMVKADALSGDLILSGGTEHQLGAVSGADSNITLTDGAAATVSSANGASFSLEAGSTLMAGAKLTAVGTLAFQNASLQLTNPAILGSSAYVTVDTLKATGDMAIGVDGMDSLAIGSYTLMSYETLAEDTQAHVEALTLLGAPQSNWLTYESVVDNVSKTITLKVASKAEALVWNTTSGTWSSSSSGAEWKSTIEGGDTKFDRGDAVIFQGGAVTLSEEVAPSDILVLGAKDTTFSGTGSIADASTESPTSLEMSSTGKLTIETDNSYSGGTTINHGTVIAKHNNALGSELVTVNDGALSLTDNVALSAQVAMNDGALSLAEGSQLTAGGDLNARSVSLATTSTLDLAGNKLNVTEANGFSMAEGAMLRNMGGGFSLAVPGKHVHEFSLGEGDMVDASLRTASYSQSSTIDIIVLKDTGSQSENANNINLKKGFFVIDDTQLESLVVGNGTDKTVAVAVGDTYIPLGSLNVSKGLTINSDANLYLPGLQNAQLGDITGEGTLNVGMNSYMDAPSVGTQAGSVNLGILAINGGSDLTVSGDVTLGYLNGTGRLNAAGQTVTFNSSGGSNNVAITTDVLNINALTTLGNKTDGAIDIKQTNIGMTNAGQSVSLTLSSTQNAHLGDVAVGAQGTLKLSTGSAIADSISGAGKIEIAERSQLKAGDINVSGITIGSTFSGESVLEAETVKVDRFNAGTGCPVRVTVTGSGDAFVATKLSSTDLLPQTFSDGKIEITATQGNIVLSGESQGYIADLSAAKGTIDLTHLNASYSGASLFSGGNITARELKLNEATDGSGTYAAKFSDSSLNVNALSGDLHLNGATTADTVHKLGVVSGSSTDLEFSTANGIAATATATSLGSPNAMLSSVTINGGTGSTNNALSVEGNVYVSAITIADGAQLTAGGDVAVDLLSGAGTLAMGGSTLTLNAQAGTSNIGTLTLGDTTTLMVAGLGGLATGDYTVLNYTTLNGDLQFGELTGNSAMSYTLSSTEGTVILNVGIAKESADVLVWSDTSGSGTWENGDSGSDWSAPSTSTGTDNFSENKQVIFQGGTANVVGEVTPGSILVVGSETTTLTTSETNSGTITGDTGLTKDGSGTLNIEVANETTGQNIIRDGVVNVTNSEGLGQGEYVIEGGAVNAETSTYNQKLTMTGGSLTVDGFGEQAEIGDVSNGIITTKGTDATRGQITVANVKNSLLVSEQSSIVVEGTVSGSGTEMKAATYLKLGDVSGTGHSFSIDTPAKDVRVATFAFLVNTESEPMEGSIVTGNVSGDGHSFSATETVSAESVEGTGHSFAGRAIEVLQQAKGSGHQFTATDSVIIRSGALANTNIEAKEVVFTMTSLEGVSSIVAESLNLADSTLVLSEGNSSFSNGELMVNLLAVTSVEGSFTLDISAMEAIIQDAGVEDISIIFNGSLAFVSELTVKSSGGNELATYEGGNAYSISISLSPAVPEPTTATLSLLALAALAARRRRK